MTRRSLNATFKAQANAWWVFIVMIAVGLSTAAQTLDSAQDVLDRMRENATRIEDLDAILVVETYDGSELRMTQRLRLSLLQPDKMRQEYLEPDYLAGNLTRIIGNEMWIYIAAADTWYRRELGDLSAAEQPWLIFRQFLRGVESEFDNYAFDLSAGDEGQNPSQDRNQEQDQESASEPYHLVGTPSSEDAVYGRIELWVDPQTFVPTHRRLYDVDANLLVELRILDVELVADSTYLARTMATYDETGERKSVIHYETLVVNGGLDPTLFARTPEDGDD
ncbi:outer membrane lipoprotein-sorting protein [Candidatus Bipolaricaulota bacterium]|nr:outer membrane lipoprotein-sorting protein [Candidatus Bipolaricaulota bacterium]